MVREDQYVNGVVLRKSSDSDSTHEAMRKRSRRRIIYIDRRADSEFLHFCQNAVKGVIKTVCGSCT